MDMLEELRWWSKEHTSTVRISSLGSLLWIKFPSLLKGHKQTNGEVMVRREIRAFLFRMKNDPRIYEVKMNEANILIYCTNKKSCDELKPIIIEINKNNFR